MTGKPFKKASAASLLILTKKQTNRRKGKGQQNQKKSSSAVQGAGILTQWFRSRCGGRPNATAVSAQTLYTTQAHHKDNSSSAYCNTRCRKFSNFLTSGCLYTLKNWELQSVFSCGLLIVSDLLTLTILEIKTEKSKIKITLLKMVINSMNVNINICLVKITLISKKLRQRNVTILQFCKYL